jgi:hypothetical protein
VQHFRLRELYVRDVRRSVLDDRPPLRHVCPALTQTRTRPKGGKGGLADAIDATLEKRRCEKKLCPWTIKEGWKHTYLCSRACFKETCIFQ